MTQKLMGYTSYKSSSIEWIGNIPLHWDITKVGNIFDITLGKMLQPQAKSEFDAEVPYLKAMNIQDGFIDYTNVDRMHANSMEMKKYKIRKGDLLVCEGGEVGRSAIVKNNLDEYIFQNSLHRLNNTTNGSVIYLHYLLNAIRNSGYIHILVNRATIAHLTKDKLSSMRICVPALDEQDAIARYLDSKSMEIDSLIDDKEKLIYLLEEKRQAIITETVTLGLNTDVEMKDSNIEWIAEIPRHWDEKKIKYLFYETNDLNLEADAELLSLFTSIGVRPRKEMEQKGNKSQTVINYKKVKKGDIVVNKLLAWMGAIGISDFEGVTSPAYDVYRALNTDLISNKYYHYYFRGHYFKGDCHKLGRGIMMMRWRTYPEQFKTIIVPIPPLDEQIKIAEYLDEKTEEIERLVLELKGSIEKLKEYRQSLIYEVVTGKINVQNYVEAT